MQALALPGVFSWSRYQPDGSMYFNSHFFALPSGNVAVDPLALEDGDLEWIASLGGVAWIVVTNRDHLRETVALRERFGARVATSKADADALGIHVDRILADGDEAFAGATVVTLEHQKTPGEFALHLAKCKALLVGDAMVGTPAGLLSLLPDPRYADVRRAALALRRLWALQPQTLLVGDGASLYSGATRAIGTLLFERAGLAANRINLDEVSYEAFTGPEGTPFRSRDAEVGYVIGAEHLGYQVVKLEPGARFCPLHAEFSEEELFIVLDGTPSIRTATETLPCRRGDFIAFPTGPEHAHQVMNESAAEATILLLGQERHQNIVYYPDSDKLLARTPEMRRMLRATPTLEYFDGE
jgi:uncharacterized cupin superfamily protein